MVTTYSRFRWSPRAENAPGRRPRHRLTRARRRRSNRAAEAHRAARPHRQSPASSGEERDTFDAADRAEPALAGCAEDAADEEPDPTAELPIDKSERLGMFYAPGAGREYCIYKKWDAESNMTVACEDGSRCAGPTHPDPARLESLFCVGLLVPLLQTRALRLSRAAGYTSAA